MSPTVTPPAEKQCKRLHLPLASRGWAGRCGLWCFLRIGLEYPRYNQSELTWASIPDWDSYHAKSSNIRHHQDRAQNKGRNRISRLQTIPLR